MNSTHQSDEPYQLLQSLMYQGTQAYQKLMKDNYGRYIRNKVRLFNENYKVISETHDILIQQVIYPKLLTFDDKNVSSNKLSLSFNRCFFKQWMCSP
jgi:hypothetical protein